MRSATIGAIASVNDISVRRLFIATPVDFVSTCTIDVYGGSFSIDWGSGFILYAGGNPAQVSQVPTGNITLRQEGIVTRVQFITDTYTGITISRATNLTSMQNICSGLTNLTGFTIQNPGSITNANSAFLNCSALTNYFGSDLSSCTDFGSTFSGCSSLIISGTLLTDSGIDFSNMFLNNSAASSIPFVNVSSGTNFSSMYSGCSNVQGINQLSSSLGLTFDNMFNGCTSLLCLTSINTLNQTNTTDMFLNTPALTDPTSAEQTSILSGSNYTNAGFCSV